MKSINKKRLNELLNRCKGKSIAVMGDIMLDRYIWGKVVRISPEAPVPVVEVNKESIQLGGAANVANNIKSLGGEPLLFGIVGDDHSGKDLKKLMIDKGFNNQGVLVDHGRPTTLKTRIIADDQHVVRADFESTEDISQHLSDRLFKLLEKSIEDIDGIIIQDYNKGFLTKSFIKNLIELALNHDCPITVDPKFNNFFEYTNVTLFKPNIVETQNALGFSLDSDERVSIAGKLLLERLQCDNVLITRGSEGMSLFSKNYSENKVETKARIIHDVSGAGDTVISTLTMILSAGGDILEAATISNHAAGVVCGEIGIVPITSEKLSSSFEINKTGKTKK
ncbi:D-glycero-beta-D-manno-heptose-7-phosphate kinase [candidate division KSB1 bacterium]|nr:D-glycero-beta-D-manno-heptose-7-phosphate kinase [candidate division KSB1 bacterium]MCH8285414.1 D-glycero-beta-D-manno-heptose-7-phosphate kinase [candidate division KSB1 bacterium]